jgi:hypothetical protein
MLVPPIAQRREIDRKLSEYFHVCRAIAFRQAISAFCRFYGVKMPRIEWYEYIDHGRTAGRTFEDGRIHLLHPENWKRCRIYNSERMWVQTVYHELAHYVFWTDAERKAEAFAVRMVRGLKRSTPRNTSPAFGRASIRRSARRASERQTRSRRNPARIRGRHQSAAHLSPARPRSRRQLAAAGK